MKWNQENGFVEEKLPTLTQMIILIPLVWCFLFRFYFLPLTNPKCLENLLCSREFSLSFCFFSLFLSLSDEEKLNVVGVTFNELFSLLCGNILLFDRNFVSFQTTRDKLMHEIDKKHTHSHKTHAKSMDCCGFLYNRHKRKKLFCNKKNATNTQYGWTVYSTGFLFPIRI